MDVVQGCYDYEVIVFMRLAVKLLCHHLSLFTSLIGASPDGFVPI